MYVFSLRVLPTWHFRMHADDFVSFTCVVGLDVLFSVINHQGVDDPKSFAVRFHGLRARV